MDKILQEQKENDVQKDDFEILINKNLIQSIKFNNRKLIIDICYGNYPEDFFNFNINDEKKYQEIKEALITLISSDNETFLYICKNKNVYSARLKFALNL